MLKRNLRASTCEPMQGNSNKKRHPSLLLPPPYGRIDQGQLRDAMAVLKGLRDRKSQGTQTERHTHQG